MRPAFIILAIFMIGGAAIAMRIGGRNLMPIERSRSVEQASSIPTEAVAPPVIEQKPANRLQPERADRLPESLVERIAPREPLSELSLALPPKPAPDVPDSVSDPLPGPLPGLTLYRPIATSSARFEAMDRIIAVAGVEDVVPDERCSYEGQDWECGIHARTAVRAFIRGRAITCDMSPDAPKEVVASCRVGTQDVGRWLVETGWARATPGGPYADAERKARQARLGVFGPPPQPVTDLP